MQKRCCNCFELYEDIDSICPYCGYSEGDKAEEIYFLQPGTLLNKNKYIVGEKAGQGGFGITYKAWDTSLQRVVAIKEFFPLSMVARSEGQKEVVVFSSKRESDYARHLERFRREAKIMSLFTDSINCIKTYDIFEENKTAYIVMEYCDAPTLKTYVKERNGELLPESEVVEIIAQVLSGLQEIHAKGVYHLDIALDNIFIKKREEKVKVTIYDFGAARLEKNLKRGIEEEIILKPGFAPPEQYKKNGKIGPWTDIYAVGANLYYLLTGVVPLEATDREHEDVMEEPAQLNLVSPAINNATLRAMALSTELRYRNARDFLEDLKKEKVRNDKEEALHRKKVRNRFIAAVSLVLMAAAALLVFVGYTKGRIFEDEIIMWVVADSEQNIEKMRYEAVISSFREYYPQIQVKLEVMSSSELEKRFLSAKNADKPDLLETTNASETVLKSCKSLSAVLHENKGVFVNALGKKIISSYEKQLPLGFYVTVVYKQSGKTMEELSRVSPKMFIMDAVGYTESDTTLYTEVQKNIAGRYEIVAGNKKNVYFTDLFSVFSRGINKEKAAKALLSYMLTEVGQEKLHITYKSNCLPIADVMFELYVGDIYREMNFLKESLEEYEEMTK